MDKKTRVTVFLLNHLIWVILAVFFLINVFTTPYFFTYRNIINILYHSSILSMLILGQSIVMATGHLDLSLESTLAFAPALAIVCMTRWIVGLDPIIAIVLTLLVGAFVGSFNGYCITRLGMNTFMQTLSILIILRGVVLFLVPFSIINLGDTYTYLGSAKIFGNIPVAVIVMFSIFIFFEFFLRKTRMGRYFFATGGNPQASYISGINTRRVITMAFMLAGLLAAVAGLFAVGRQSSVTNQMGEGMVFFAFAGALLGGASLSGGKGTPFGMLGGALLLTAISNSLNLLGVNVFLVYASQGALIFFALVLDRVRVRVYALIFERERIRKFRTSLE